MLSNRYAPVDRVAEAAGSPRRPRRVCLMIGQLGLGGSEKQVVLLAQGLHALGISVTVLVMRGGGPREKPLRDAGIAVVPLGFRRLVTVRGAAANAAALLRLGLLLRRERPDVLHAFLAHAYLVAAPVARLARVPVVVAGRRSLAFFKQGRPLLRAAERLANRATDLLIANAHAVADDTRRHEGVPAGKVTVVYNGLADAAFAPPVPACIDAAHPVVLCVANLLRYKGHRYLLEAAGQLRARGRECTLVLAGEGPERAPLQGQAARLGIDVRILGPRDDVEPLLARADVVVLPSLTEGLSNAVMEAMASGRPIVATSVGGTPELLEGRGVLVPPADPAALADGIERLLADPALASRLGAQARAWSLAHLRADAMVDRHVRIYAGLLERKCAG